MPSPPPRIISKAHHQLPFYQKIHVFCTKYVNIHYLCTENHSYIIHKEDFTIVKPNNTKSYETIGKTTGIVQKVH